MTLPLLTLATAAVVCAIHIWQQQTIINKLLAMSDQLTEIQDAQAAEKTVLDTIQTGVAALETKLTDVQTQLTAALAAQPADLGPLLTQAKANLAEAQAIATALNPAPAVPVGTPPVEAVPAPAESAPTDAA